MQYSPDWDLSTIPPELIKAEYGRLVRDRLPDRSIRKPCVAGCGEQLNTRQRRKPCPKCGAKQPRD